MSSALSELAEVSKRKRDTARGGGTGAAIGGGLAAAAIGGAALKFRKPLRAIRPELKQIYRHGTVTDEGDHISGRAVKLTTAGVLGVPVAASAGVGSAVGAGIGRKRENHIGKAVGWRTSDRVPLVARKLHGVMDNPITAPNSGHGTTTTFPHSNKEYSALRAKQAAQRKQVKGAAKVAGGVTAGYAAGRVHENHIGKAFATRDQNSSVPTSTSWGKTDSRLRSATLRGTERGNAGSGRKGVLTTKDQNSSPKVQWVQPRHRETGRFVSHENDLKIFRPAGRTGRHEGPSGKLGHYTKSPTRVAHGVRKSLDLPGNGKVGRRLA